jgi:hypothetical protein
VDLSLGDFDNLIDGEGKRPVEAGLEQGRFTDASRGTEEEFDGHFLRSNRENAGDEKEQNEAGHHQAHNDEAALQRVGKRLRAGILKGSLGRRLRGGGMIVVVAWAMRVGVRVVIWTVAVVAWTVRV